jgi:hypothetical protein
MARWLILEAVHDAAPLASRQGRIP